MLARARWRGSVTFLAIATMVSLRSLTAVMLVSSAANSLYLLLWWNHAMGLDALSQPPHVLANEEKLAEAVMTVVEPSKHVTRRAGRTDLRNLLRQAGVDVNATTELPNWDTIESLYGSEPRIVGLESCARYRDAVPLPDRFLGVAGLFNTGTNALAWSLVNNIQMPTRPRWQVPWGKHQLASVRLTHETEHNQMNASLAFPVAIVKDPMMWLHSMCHNAYSAHWKRVADHCPNLVHQTVDRHTMQERTAPVEALIMYSKENRVHWESLVEMWNDWYRQYLDADYPRLLVRFEDFLFRPEFVLEHVAECVGGDLVEPIHFQSQSSKGHGSQTDLLHAMVRYGRGEGRLGNMTQLDLDYAREVLDDRLLQLFSYQKPPPTTIHKQMSVHLNAAA